MWGKILAVGKKFVETKVKQKALEKGTEAAQDSGLLSRIEQIPMLIGCTGISGLALLLITPFIIFVGSFGTIFIMQGVDPYFASASTNVGVDLNYDFEEYFALSEEAFETPNNPSVDLSGTEFSDIDGFNQHIKDMVESAGYGTREAVVAAGVALIGDYIKTTGKRIRYNQLAGDYGIPYGRQASDVEGIITDNFYLDCSSFAWWALYNGGFNMPSYPQTESQSSWSNSSGYSRTPGEGVGQGGDFLVTYGHIILVIGNYDGGYYCAEENGWGIGGRITKHSYESLGGYTLIDMTDYYNDSSNVR